MMGVSVDGINALLRECELYYSSYNNNSAKLLTTLSDLQSCYNGDDLDFLFDGIINATESIKPLSNILDNYSSIVRDVKFAYETQDINLRTQTSRID